MRRLIWGGVLVLAGMLAEPVMAGWVYQFNTDDSLSWRIADHSLKLHSDRAGTCHAGEDVTGTPSVI